MRARNKFLYSDLLNQDNSQYYIPVYQRIYTWTNKHCEQLYNDIINSVKLKNHHYLGSLVYSESKYIKDNNTFYRRQIVDGQQRFTSVLLLLKALYDSLDDETDKKIRDKIYNSIYNNNIDDEFKLKLQTINEDNNQLSKILLDDFSSLDDLSNIAKNYYYFKNRINDSINNEGLTAKKILCGIENLMVVAIVLDKKDNPQVIFESINSTGKELNDAEKIRNFLLMDISVGLEQGKYYSKYWVGLDNAIGNDNLQNFFFDYLVMKKGTYVEESELYSSFKEFFFDEKKSGKNIYDIGDDLLKYAEYYKLLVCNDSKYYSSLTQQLCEIFKSIRHNTIYSFLMNVCDDYQDIQKLYKKTIQISQEEKTLLKDKENEFNEIIKFFINYAIRRNVCEISSGSLRRFYATLYYNIFKIDSNKKKYFAAIKSYVCGLKTDDKFPTDEVFKDRLVSVNMYKKSNVLQLLFNDIENKGKEPLDFETLTIEHILPQTPDSEWYIDLGKDFDMIYDKYLHTLGNLSITGYNSEFQNKGYKKKKQALNELNKSGELKVKILNEEMLDDKITKWDEDVIKSRADRLSKKIIENYCYPTKLDKSIEFNTYFEVYIEDNKIEVDGDYKLCGFRIKDIKYKCKKYTDLYVSFLNCLYNINPNILNQLAEDKWSFARATKAYISKDDSEMVRPKELSDSNIYVETNFNRWYIFDAIVDILSKYDNEVSFNDFCLLYDSE